MKNDLAFNFFDKISWEPGVWSLLPSALAVNCPIHTNALLPNKWEWLDQCQRTSRSLNPSYSHRWGFGVLFAAFFWNICINVLLEGHGVNSWPHMNPDASWGLNRGRTGETHLPIERSAPVDFVYARKAAKRKIEERSSALPTTPVTCWYKNDSSEVNQYWFIYILYIQYRFKCYSRLNWGLD